MRSGVVGLVYYSDVLLERRGNKRMVGIGELKNGSRRCGAGRINKRRRTMISAAAAVVARQRWKRSGYRSCTRRKYVLETRIMRDHGAGSRCLRKA